MVAPLFVRVARSWAGALMRWALLADVHSNLEALDAVLAHIERRGGARLAVAGDLVGYGADPAAVIDRLRQHNAVCVAGNHEGMIVGRLGFEKCIHRGIRAALWTREALNDLELRWLAALPVSRPLPPDLVLCHGDLDDVERYVTSPQRAEDALDRLRTRYPAASLLVCGHTHRPVLYSEGGVWAAPPVGIPLRVPTSRRCLLNPGSVGQSRDEKLVARYVLYDVERGEVTFHEVLYEHRRTREKMKRAGLDPYLARRQEGRIKQRVDRVRTRVARWAAARKPAPQLLPGTSSTPSDRRSPRRRRAREA